MSCSYHLNTIAQRLIRSPPFQIAAHNKHKHLLQRDTSLVVVLTFAVLLLAAFLANTCVQILRHHGYIYTTSSFGKCTTVLYYLRHSDWRGTHNSHVIALVDDFREDIRIYVYETCQSTGAIGIQQHTGEVHVARILSPRSTRNSTRRGHEHRVWLSGVKTVH